MMLCNLFLTFPLMPWYSSVLFVWLLCVTVMIRWCWAQCSPSFRTCWLLTWSCSRNSLFCFRILLQSKYQFSVSLYTYSVDIHLQCCYTPTMLLYTYSVIIHLHCRYTPTVLLYTYSVVIHC